MAELDVVDRHVRALVYTAVARAYGTPGFVNCEPVSNVCDGCGADADVVGVDGVTGLCAECETR